MIYENLEGNFLIFEEKNLTRRKIKKILRVAINSTKNIRRLKQNI